MGLLFFDDFHHVQHIICTLGVIYSCTRIIINDDVMVVASSCLTRNTFLYEKGCLNVGEIKKKLH